MDIQSVAAYKWTQVLDVESQHAKATVTTVTLLATTVTAAARRNNYGILLDRGASEKQHN
jgi:hypothetical protein